MNVKGNLLTYVWSEFLGENKSKALFMYVCVGNESRVLHTYTASKSWG